LTPLLRSGLVSAGPARTAELRLRKERDRNAERTRRDEEPGRGEFTQLRDGELELLLRREQMARDRRADEPAHQQLLRQINDLNREEDERLGRTAA
jgi:hypothetical protein